MSLILTLDYLLNPTKFQMFLTITVANFSATVLGMTAGQNSWNKTSFRFNMIAMTALPIIGLVNLAISEYPYGTGPLGFGALLAWSSGIPLTTLSLLSLICIAVNQREFKLEPEPPSTERARMELVRTAEHISLLNFLCKSLSGVVLGISLGLMKFTVSGFFLSFQQVHVAWKCGESDCSQDPPNKFLIGQDIVKPETHHASN